MKTLIFLLTLFIQQIAFAAGISGGGGGTPARTIEDIFKGIDAGALLNRPKGTIFEIPTTDGDIKDIYLKGFGKDPRTVTTYDQNVIPLRPSSFNLIENSVDVQVDDSTTWRFWGETNSL